jgi:hypothetical protein
MEDHPTRVLDRTTPLEAPPRRAARRPHGAARAPGREPEAVYRRRRLVAAVVGGLVFLLLIVFIANSGGSDPAPKSTPSDLGVGGGPTIKTPSTDRSKAKKNDTTAGTGSGTVTPSTPPATGGTGGTTATPVAPAQPQGTGGGVGQAPPTQTPPAAPTGEGGGAAAPPGQ